MTKNKSKKKNRNANNNNNTRANNTNSSNRDRFGSNFLHTPKNFRYEDPSRWTNVFDCCMSEDATTVGMLDNLLCANIDYGVPAKPTPSLGRGMPTTVRSNQSLECAVGETLTIKHVADLEAPLVFRKELASAANFSGITTSSLRFQNEPQQPELSARNNDVIAPYSNSPMVGDVLANTTVYPQFSILVGNSNVFHAEEDPLAAGEYYITVSGDWSNLDNSLGVSITKPTLDSFSCVIETSLDAITWIGRVTATIAAGTKSENTLSSFGGATTFNYIRLKLVNNSNSVILVKEVGLEIESATYSHDVEYGVLVISQDNLDAVKAISGSPHYEGVRILGSGATLTPEFDLTQKALSIGAPFHGKIDLHEMTQNKIFEMVGSRRLPLAGGMHSILKPYSVEALMAEDKNVMSPNDFWMSNVIRFGPYPMDITVDILFGVNIFIESQIAIYSPSPSLSDVHYQKVFELMKHFPAIGENNSHLGKINKVLTTVHRSLEQGNDIVDDISAIARNIKNSILTFM